MANAERLRQWATIRSVARKQGWEVISIQTSAANWNVVLQRRHQRLALNAGSYKQALERVRANK